jgi:hypothetical protein
MGASSGPVPPLWPRLLLREVAVGAADDQLLFEANVRLQYSQEERLVLPTLQVGRSQQTPGRPQVVVAMLKLKC